MVFVIAVLTVPTVEPFLQYAEAQYGMPKIVTYPTIELQWIPSEPVVNQEVTFTVTFRDAASGMPKSHIDYTFALSKEGTVINSSSGHTHTGSDKIKQKVTAEGINKATVTVTGIDFKSVEPRSKDFSITVTGVSVEKQLPSVVTVAKSKEPVEVDGRWTTMTEWIEAVGLEVTDGEFTAYLRAKHDNVFLYILIDFVSDQGLDNSADVAVVCFDTGKDGGNNPLDDDYCFYRVTRAGEFMDGIIQGDGKGWKVLHESRTWDPYEEKFDAAIGYSSMNDLYDSVNKHVIYEYRIPIDSYGLKEHMGFYVYVNDAFKNRFIEWPADAGAKQLKLIVKDVLPSPDKWGSMQMELEKQEVPADLQPKKESVDVRVQAKQIKDLIILRVRNMGDSTEDIYALRISLLDSSLKAFKGPKGWDRAALLDNAALFSTSAEPIRPDESTYFILKTDGVKPEIEWTVYGSGDKELVKGTAVPIFRT
jgi:hypothetical protein